MCESLEREVLDIEINTKTFQGTLREYFKRLLYTLWKEADGFSGKRPLGSSDWQFDVYKALIKEVVIEGFLDQHGYIQECDTKAADKLILELINTHLFA